MTLTFGVERAQKDLSRLDPKNGTQRFCRQRASKWKFSPFCFFFFFCCCCCCCLLFFFHIFLPPRFLFCPPPLLFLLHLHRYHHLLRRRHHLPGFHHSFLLFIAGEPAFPLNLSPMQCSRKEIRAFAEEARQLGIQYIGLCCGSSSFYLREIAEAYGKTPPSCTFSPDIAQSFAVGNHDNLPELAKRFRAHVTGRKTFEKKMDGE